MSQCTHCDGQLQHNRAKHGKPDSWQCTLCGRAGTYSKHRIAIGSRVITVTVRDALREGDPALYRPWVPAELLPYAERVS